MALDEILKKFELYILSLWLLFFLMIVVTVDIPICFGENCYFIGFSSFFFKKYNTTNLIDLFIDWLFFVLKI